jgi:diguanylate cyclase (GGDEF)-like protein
MQEAEQKLVRSPAFSQAVLGVFFAASIALLFLVDLQFRFDDAIAQGKKTALNFAKILAEHTALTFDGVERTLREAAKIRQDSLEGKYASSEDTNSALRLLQKTSPVVVAVGWTNASGDLIAHSYDQNPPGANIASMSHFIVQRESADNRLYIAPPYRSVANDKWFTAASLRLSNAEGTFTGILTAPLDQSYFIKIYRSIDLGNNGSILLLHRDGPLLAREPALDSAIGKSFAGGPLLTRYLPKSDAGSYETVSVVDGVPRVAGYMAVRGLPLVLLVSYARADVLGPWHRHLSTFGPLVALVVAAILFGTFLLVRQTMTLAEKSGILESKSRELEQTNRRFDIALSNMPSGLVMFDADQKIVISNFRFREMYGLKEDQVRPGTLLKDLLESHVANGQRSEHDMDAYIRTVLTQPTQTQPLADGRTVFIRRQTIPEGGWIATHEDITEQKRTETSLLENAAELERINMRFDAALNTMSHGLCMYDAEQKVVVSNTCYAEIYHLDREQVKPGTSLQQILDYRLEKGTHFGPAADVYISGNLKNPNEIQELADGRTVSIARHTMPDGGWLTIHEDITERARNEKRIAFLAQHDLLTGLANRALFAQKLDEAAKRFQRYGISFSVLMLDLDRFKNVNDTLGHPAGDQLLVQVAQRLTASLRDTDVLARLGGDEFAIIQENEKDQREGAIGLALRIIGIIGEPFDLNGHRVNIGTSIGVVFAPEHGVDLESLLKKADLALYDAKASGRNDFCLFRTEMIDAAQSQKALENELRDAISNEEFELHYQPVMDVETRQLRGVEALVRWRHPSRGLVSPDQFIPLAESTGLILPLGEWVLQQACRDAVHWPAHVKVAVNISAVQFNKGNLFDVILCTLVETGLPPDRLELEITETALLEGRETHLQTIRQLKNLGIVMVLDDFGTGYSSASYLTKFPFDKIKIDKSITQGAAQNRACAAVVASALALARGLEIATTAEGIETEEQFELLRAAGANLAQGFLFGRPVPLHGFGKDTPTLHTEDVA